MTAHAADSVAPIPGQAVGSSSRAASVRLRRPCWHSGWISGSAGRPDLYSVAVATLMLAMASNVRWIAIGVAISILVPPSALSRVNALQQAFERTVMISGPMLGAVALAYFGLGATIVLALASSLLAFASLGFITVQRSASQQGMPAAGRHFWAEIGFGFRWIWREPILRRLLLFVAGNNFAGGLFTTTSTPYLLSFTSSRVLGSSLTVEGVGAMLMGALLARWSEIVPPERCIVLAATLFGGLMLAWGMTRTPVPILALSLTIGMLTTTLIAALQTTWQLRVPLDIQGRVFATRRMLSSLLLPVSTLISIPASERIFKPLLHAWPPAAAIWGTGQAGTLGMMVSTLGVALLAGCMAYYWRGTVRPPGAKKSVATFRRG